MKKYRHALSRMSSYQVICIIPIFGVSFGQNLCVWPPAVPIYRVTPTALPLILNKYHHGLSWMWLLHVLSNDSNWEFICIISIFEVILVKIWVFDPPGCLYMGVPPTVSPLIMKKYQHALSWMYMCDYFVLSNGPNREVLWIIPDIH